MVLFDDVLGWDRVDSWGVWKPHLDGCLIIRVRVLVDGIRGCTYGGDAVVERDGVGLVSPLDAWI